MEQYLAFVDEIGRGTNGEYLYRFDYTTDIDSFWGEYFNIVPAVIIPNLQPDINYVSRQERIMSKTKLEVAKRNGCFSMQDCIDGIISLCFSEIDDYTLYFNNEPLKFDFGEVFESVQEKINNCGLISLGIEDINIDDDSEIDNLIDSLGGEE